MSDWSGFARRCADTVRKIRDTKDDGVYAKLYASDVERLLRMLDQIEISHTTTHRDLFELLDRVFEETK